MKLAIYGPGGLRGRKNSYCADPCRTIQAAVIPANGTNPGDKNHMSYRFVDLWPADNWFIIGKPARTA